MTTTLCPASVQLTGKDMSGHGEGCSSEGLALGPHLLVGLGVSGCLQEMQLVCVSLMRLGLGSSCGLTSLAEASQMMSIF